MCKTLNISRQTYYYQTHPIQNESEVEEIVQKEFIRNRKAYGTRKFKKRLAKRELQLSRRQIGRIMKCRGSYLCSRGEKWHYICLALDLLNREIIGYSCGEKRTR